MEGIYVLLGGLLLVALFGLSIIIRDALKVKHS